MIHKNLYSTDSENVINGVKQSYALFNNQIKQSILIIFAKYDWKILLSTLRDLCENRGWFISNNFKKFLVYGEQYDKKMLIDDIEQLLSLTVDYTFDFIEIFISNINYEVQLLSSSPYENDATDEICNLKILKERFIQCLNNIFFINEFNYEIANDVIIKKQEMIYQNIIFKKLDSLLYQHFEKSIAKLTDDLNNNINIIIQETCDKLTSCLEQTQKDDYL